MSTKLWEDFNRDMARRMVIARGWQRIANDRATVQIQEGFIINPVEIDPIPPLCVHAKWVSIVLRTNNLHHSGDI